MQSRRRFKQTISLGDRLAEEAVRLRQQARGTPQGILRERLLRKARQNETAININKWLASPGLKSPT
jgi:hypothetical protein